MPENPVSRPGDMWLLGEHHVLCGDSTDSAYIEHLLTNKHPQLIITNPPYSIEYDPNWRNEANISKTKRTNTITNNNQIN